MAVGRLFSFRSVLVGALLLPLSAGLHCAQAQLSSNTGTIAGEVRVQRGGFPSGRLLVTVQTRGVQAGTAYTDGEGRFSFEDLPGNLYHIVINEPDYEPIDYQIALNPSIQHVAYAHLQLVPRNVPGASASRVQGSNPALVDESTLLANFSKSAQKHYRKATQLQAKGKRPEAAAEYEKALGEAPEMYFARNNLGSLYLENQQFADAESQFRKVIESNAADANAYFNLANVCLITRRLNDARDWIRQGMSRDPQSAFGHFLLGSVMLQQGKPEDAEKELRSALTQDPQMSNAHLALVNLYLQQNRRADAAQELTAFLHGAPDSPFAAHARELLKKLQAEALSK